MCRSFYHVWTLNAKPIIPNEENERLSSAGVQSSDRTWRMWWILTRIVAEALKNEIIGDGGGRLVSVGVHAEEYCAQSVSDMALEEKEQQAKPNWYAFLSLESNKKKLDEK